jgi:hypothetical protein
MTIQLLEYNSIHNISLEVKQIENDTVTVNRVNFVLTDPSAESIYTRSLLTNFKIPYTLYAIFDANYFNQLQSSSRYQVFRNLIDFINTGE